MKALTSLTELAEKIERQAASKRDFIAPARKLQLETVPPGEGAGLTLHMENGNGGYNFGITELAHDQLAERLAIPKNYYDRCRATAPGLLTNNVNHWLTTSPAKYMVRTLDENVRAFLSDRYRPLDNVDLAEAVLPIILDKRWMVRDCEITERCLYIKVVSKELQAIIKSGARHGNDRVVHPGLMISNSEVGLGMVRITPSLHWPHCYNIALVDEAGTGRVHTGKRDERFGDIAGEFFKDETKKADDRAFWMKVRDIVTATLTQELFGRMVAKFETATEAEIEGDPTKVVELTAKRYGLTESERVSVLRHLIEDGDLSLYGLSNAITRAAQDGESYDRGTDLERLGGEIIELDRSAWKELQPA
jgi:hypothetical protein